MNVAGVIFRPLYWVAGKVFATWARPAVQPDKPAAFVSGDDAEVYYVLETGGLADNLALDRSCRMHGMPSPFSSLRIGGVRENRRVIILRRTRGFIFRRKRVTGSTRLRRLVKASIAANGKEVSLLLRIPTSRPRPLLRTSRLKPLLRTAIRIRKSIDSQ